MKWAVELREQDIEYRPRTAVKAQALADFIYEMPEVPNSSQPPGAPEPTPVISGEDSRTRDPWSLYVDGSSNTEESGARVLLISPEGEEMAYALRFDFKATNNEAEYEALIAGLKLAQRMKASKVKAHSDLQIVVQ